MLMPGSVVSSDKFVGCTLAAAVGDALGMPVETMDGCEIRARFGNITGFISPINNPHMLSSVPDIPHGGWTDDTQLTIATMNALIRGNGKFIMDYIAEAHVDAYNSERRGWGRSTRLSCKKLNEGKSWQESGEANGAGNGVIMKISPLGLRHGVIRQRLDDFIRDCITYAQMTHLGTPAIVGGAIHALAVAYLAVHHNHELDIMQFLDHFFKIAKHVEDDFNLPAWPYDKISQQLKLVIDKFKSGNLFYATPEDIAVWFSGGTSYAPNSFGLSYALFVRKPLSFECVFDAVNAGGDTDSNASIVGSLVGALNGTYIIPENLLREVEDSQGIQRLAKEFFDIVMSYKNSKST